jgi:hypothetical protein
MTAAQKGERRANSHLDPEDAEMRDESRHGRKSLKVKVLVSGTNGPESDTLIRTRWMRLHVHA